MKKALGKYIFSLLLFGTNGIVAGKIALDSYEIVLTRSFLGAAFLAAVLLFTRRGGVKTAPTSKKSFLLVAVSGVAMGASWMLLYEAYANVGVSVATLIYYVGPVLVMASAPLFFRERMIPARLLGFGAVLIGMYLVNMRELTAGGVSWGFVCAAFSAVLYAVMVIFNKQAEGITGLKNAVLQLVFGFAVVAVFTFFKQGIALDIPAQSVPAIILLGINTGFGCYLYFSALPHLPAQSVAICGYLEPVSAVAFAAIFLREQLEIVQLAGMVLILGGAAFAELYKPRRTARDGE